MTRKLWAILFVALVGATEQPRYSFMTPELSDVLIGISQTLVQHFINELPEADVKDVSHRNLIYDQMLPVITGLLRSTTDAYIPSIKNDTIGLELNDVHIYGIDTTFVKLESGSGYDMTNLTIIIPELEIVAASYKLHNFNLGNLITLNGDGTVRVVISSLFFTANLQISYSSVRREFSVKHVRWWEFSVMDSKFELENLGAAGEAISNLLNNIASEVVPAIVRALNNDIITSRDYPDQWAKFEGVVMPVIQNAMNEALKKILFPNG